MEDQDRAMARWELGTPNVASLLSRPRREIRDGGDPAEAAVGGRQVPASTHDGRCWSPVINVVV